MLACTNFGNAFTQTTFGQKLQTAASVLGANCTEQDPLNSWRAALLDYAANHSMDGGDSNGCLHLFMARFTDSQDAVMKLKSAIVKYIFIGVNLQSFCDIATDGGSPTASILKGELFPVAQAFRSVVETLNSVSTNMTEPWACDEKVPVPSPTGPTDEPGANTSDRAGDSSTKTTSGQARRRDVGTSQRNQNSVLSTGGIKGSMAWAQRAKEHQKIADNIYKKLNASRNGVSFQVFVSLLHEKSQSDMQCMHSNANDRHIKSFNIHGVSYFIQCFERADDPADIWNDVEEKKAEIVNAVFSSKTDDLCRAAKDVIAKAVRRRVFDIELGFSGLAVVRCARQFVWYQLGYRYFFVAGTAGESYELASSNDAYDSNCGQIFLFP